MVRKTHDYFESGSIRIKRKNCINGSENSDQNSYQSMQIKPPYIERCFCTKRLFILVNQLLRDENYPKRIIVPAPIFQVRKSQHLYLM